MHLRHKLEVSIHRFVRITTALLLIPLRKIKIVPVSLRCNVVKSLASTPVVITLVRPLFIGFTLCGSSDSFRSQTCSWCVFY